MGLDRTLRKLRRFRGNRRSFVEILSGPSLARTIYYDANTAAFPLFPLGNRAVVDFGVSVLNGLGVPTDHAFIAEANRQGEPFNDLTVIIYTGLSDQEFDLAATGSSTYTDRVRSLLSFYTAGSHTIIMRFKWTKPEQGHAEFVAPPYRRGIINRYTDDPVSVELLGRCVTDRISDDRLHYFIELLVQSHAIEDEQFRIARLFSILELLSGPIKSQFNKQGHEKATRTAIRFMLGYFVDFDIPRFTLLPDREFEFDHIELAGRLRDKIFHGGGTLDATDVATILQPGVELLKLRPGMISHQLRKDCEREIGRWATGESRARQASEGTEFQYPVRDQNYSGKELAKPLISGTADPKTAIGSVFVRVEGGDSSIVKLHLQA